MLLPTNILLILPFLISPVEDFKWSNNSKPILSTSRLSTESSQVHAQRLRNNPQEAFITRLKASRQAESLMQEASQLVKIRIETDWKQVELKLEQAFDFAIEAGDFSLQSTILRNLGDVYINQEKFSSALDSYNQSLVLAKKGINTAGQVHSMNAVGRIYLEMSQEENAHKILQDALNLTEDRRNYIGKNSRWQTLILLGETELRMNQIDSSEEYFRESMKLASSLGTCQSLVGSTRGFSSLFSRRGRYSKALGLLKDLLDRCGKHSGYRSYLLNDIGSIYVAQKKYRRASSYFRDALNQAEIDQNFKLVNEIQENLNGLAQ